MFTGLLHVFDVFCFFSRLSQQGLKKKENLCCTRFQKAKHFLQR